MSDEERIRLAREVGATGDPVLARRLLALCQRVDPSQVETDQFVDAAIGRQPPPPLFSDRVRITMSHVDGHWLLKHVEKKSSPAEFRFGEVGDKAWTPRCQTMIADGGQCCRQDGHRGLHVDERGINV